MKEKLESLAQSYIESIAPSDPNFDISTLKYEYDIFMLGAEAAVKLLTAPDVSKCEDIEREASCKHSDWVDLYYSSGDLYGRYCKDCGDFFE